MGPTAKFFIGYFIGGAIGYVLYALTAPKTVTS